MNKLLICMSVLASMIIAHRGGALLGTENSLSCIEKGIATGADMVEVDLHLTADRQIVVCHDRKVNRTTNGKGKIEEMTLAQIRCKGKCRLLLEIKKKRDDQYPGIEALADSIVKAHGMEGDVVFQSFNDDVLFKLHAIDPTLRLEKLLVVRIGNLLIDNSFAKFSWEKYDFVASFNIFRLFATGHFVRDMHAHGKEVKVWTVDDPAKAPAGVDGIITDRPDLFVGERQR